MAQNKSDDCDSDREELEDMSVEDVYKINSNINSDDIDAEEAKKLRGDAIGDTMYSESFVVELLLKLQDLKWSDKVEEDFCFLWDMAVEKEVCDYLLSVIYPSVACQAIKNYSNQNRLVEILIGIMGNICCTASDLNKLNDSEIIDFLSFLESDDPLILIQVVRLLKAIAFKDVCVSCIDENVMEHLSFILSNSLNCELLFATLDAVSTITNENKLNEGLIKGELLKSCVVAYQSISNKEQNDDQFVTDKLINTFTNLTKITCNLCSYIDSNANLENEIKEHLGIFVEEVSKIFTSFSGDDNLSSIWLELQFYLDAYLYIFPLLNVDYHSKLFISLIKITKKLLNSSHELDSLLELVAYFIINGNFEIIKSDFCKLSNNDGYQILLKIMNDVKLCELKNDKNVKSLCEALKK